MEFAWVSTRTLISIEDEHFSFRASANLDLGSLTQTSSCSILPYSGYWTFRMFILYLNVY